MITETAQYMTFKLGVEPFAIGVAQVHEALEITKAPAAPAYMRGVVDVRGQATPAVDLLLKFGAADSVHEVVELEVATINPPPRIAMQWRTDSCPEYGEAGR
jgi:purine-binding chemotaxis protein CheW